MPAGAPSKYDPAYCERVVALGEEGKTIAEMAADLDVARTTFNDWREQHEEFSYAVRRGIEKAQAWWESNGRVATFGGFDGFSATSYIFQMKNRFRDDWADRQLLGSDPENPLPKGFDVTFTSAPVRPAS